MAEEIAQHLYRAGWKGNENNIYSTVRNEFVERSNNKPSYENVRATIERLQKLSAQNKE